MGTDKVSDKVIEEIKETTDLCDTICCYEDCERCVEKYLNQNIKGVK